MKGKLVKFLFILTLVLSCFTVVSCGCGEEEEPDTPVNPEVNVHDLSYRDAKGTTGIVTSGTSYASNAGLEILKAGGNAFDAAAAVAWALGVTEPNATGLGGGGSLLGYIASTGDVFQLGFNATCAAGTTVDKYDEETHLDQMKRGKMSVALPGTVIGFETLVKKYGSGNVTLSDTLQPAIKLAKEGFELTPALEPAIYYDYFIAENMTQTLEIYGNGRRAHRVGDIITNPNQAKVLEEIAAKGSAGFYKGWVAENMVKATEEAGMITLSDYEWMMNNGVVETTPLHSTYTSTRDGKKYDIYATTTPNSGGYILVETLNELEMYCKAKGISISDLGYDNPEWIHLFASATQYAYADRRAYVADVGINPATNEPFNTLPLSGLLNKNYAYDRFVKVFNPKGVYLKTSTSDYGEKIGVDPWDYMGPVKKSKYNTDAPNQDSEGTTSFNVIDKDGNMCVVTFTNSSYWGSYVMPDGCGFMLNNSVTNFNWTAGINQFMPYKRSAGYISPMMSLIDGSPFCCVGSPGSEKIPVVQTEVFLNMVEFGMSVKEAVEKGRVFCYRVTADDTIDMEEGDTYLTKKLISIETYDYSESTLNALRKLGYSIHAYKEPGIAACQAARVNYDSNMNKTNYEGCGDARRGGKSLAY